jgi:hypothetical protein
MATLNSWQKITRVQTGQPFGSGGDGAYSSATVPTLTKDSCSGTSSSTTLTTSGSTFANGDLLLIHQTRGTGVGQWEINKVSSGGGTTSLTLQTALQYTYTDSGSSQAQAIKIPQYTDVTVQSGTWTIPAWDGNTGGILVFGATGTVTVTGDITGTGTAGVNGANTSPSNGGGFVGGISKASPSTQAVQGEGSAAAGSASTSANGNGGGGAYSGDGIAGGGGGGNGVAGSNGTDQASATVKGTGGSTSGAADLTTMTFGGAGGGGASNGDADSGSGGNGGGILVIFGATISVSGTINVGGGNGGTTGSSSADNTGGGAGAGGSILIGCDTATLGTTKLLASGGTGGVGFRSGGDGGAGRIAVHHNDTVTGTTTPTFTDTTDTDFAGQSASLSPSASASSSASASASASLSPSASTSPSSSVSRSLSPSSSASVSASASLSPSASASRSASRSASASASRSQSASESPSMSPSLSASASQSPSASESPSASASESPSISPSRSASASFSPSPSMGYASYSRQAADNLPNNDSDLETLYSEQEEANASVRDNTRVAISGQGKYLIHEFKNFAGSQTTCKVEFEGRSTLAPSGTPVYLQIYHTTNGWETILTNSSSPANADFEMEVRLANLTNYKDGGGIVACRVYQLAASDTTYSLSTDYFDLIFPIEYSNNYSDKNTSYSNNYSSQNNEYTRIYPPENY